MTRHDPRDSLRAEALRLGFCAVGFAPAALPPEFSERLQTFLQAGFHGDMGWLEARADSRANPQVLWPAARSALVVAESYAPAQDPLANLGEPLTGNLSAYARNLDYHDTMKPRLKALARFAQAKLGGEVKVFVDTAPLMEKPLAALAGIGWQGKHTNLLSRTAGNWFFLGVVLLSIDLAPDAPATAHCGSCQRCLDSCPTKAFPAPYQLEARRCISYLTIEHKGPIDPELRPLLGNRIYGCDDCLAVCPWNSFAQAAHNLAYEAREGLQAPSLLDLVELDEAGFRAHFAKSPVKRIGRARLLRNVLIALGNSGDAAALPAVRRRLDDGAPLVRGAAIWALGRLSPAHVLQESAARLTQESDETVRREWRLALTM